MCTFAYNVFLQVVYGINTGFGQFSDVVIAPEKLKDLQLNLIRSHAAGVGPALSSVRVRRILALRINTLAKGTKCRNFITLLLSFNFLTYKQASVVSVSKLCDS